MWMLALVVASSFASPPAAPRNVSDSAALFAFQTSCQLVYSEQALVSVILREHREKLKKSKSDEDKLDRTELPASLNADDIDRRAVVIRYCRTLFPDALPPSDPITVLQH